MNLFCLVDIQLKSLDEHYEKLAESFGERLLFEDKIELIKKKIEEKEKYEYQQKVNLSLKSKHISTFILIQHNLI